MTTTIPYDLIIYENVKLACNLTLLLSTPMNNAVSGTGMDPWQAGTTLAQMNDLMLGCKMGDSYSCTADSITIFGNDRNVSADNQLETSTMILPQGTVIPTCIYEQFGPNTTTDLMQLTTVLNIPVTSALDVTLTLPTFLPVLVNKKSYAMIEVLLLGSPSLPGPRVTPNAGKYINNDMSGPYFYNCPYVSLPAKNSINDLFTLDMGYDNNTIITLPVNTVVPTQIYTQFWGTKGIPVSNSPYISQNALTSPVGSSSLLLYQVILIGVGGLIVLLVIIFMIRRRYRRKRHLLKYRRH